MGGFGHGGHILRRDIGKNGFMARADDEVGPQKLFNAPDFCSHVFRRSMIENALSINSSQERYFPLEIARQGFGVHVPGPRLERMEAVDAGIDETADNPMD